MLVNADRLSISPGRPSPEGYRKARLLCYSTPA
jgi:hypothetical protein